MKIPKIIGTIPTFGNSQPIIQKETVVPIPPKEGKVQNQNLIDAFIKSQEEEPKPIEQKKFSEQIGFKKREPKKFE